MSRPLFPGRPRRIRGTLVDSNMWYERASDIETDNIKKVKNQLENFYKIASGFDDETFVGFQKDEIEASKNRLNLKSFDNVTNLNKEKVTFGPVSSTPKVKKVVRKIQSPQFSDDDHQNDKVENKENDDNKPDEKHTKKDKKCEGEEKVRKSTKNLEKLSNEGGETSKKSNEVTTNTNKPPKPQKKDEKKGEKRQKKKTTGKVGRPANDVNQPNNELYKQLVNNLEDIMLENLENFKDIPEEQLRDPRLLDVFLQSLKK